MGDDLPAGASTRITMVVKGPFTNSEVFDVRFVYSSEYISRETKKVLDCFRARIEEDSQVSVLK